MIIRIKLDNNRNFECSSNVIGKTYENKATVLEYLLTEEMKDKDFYIEFEKADETKFVTPRQDIVITDEGYIVNYEVPNALLDFKGELKTEVVLRDSNEVVWKSYTMKFNILNSINATEELTEEFPDLITEAQKVIDCIEKDGDGSKFLADDGTYKTGAAGTMDYAELANKPSIEGIELEGNKTLEDLGIQPKGDYAASNDIPTKISQLENDSNFITDFAEEDPTVPLHVKNITQEDIDKWNSGNSGGSGVISGSYNDLTDKPFINMTGTEDSPIYLRQLQTGAYILNGVCSPYEGSGVYMNANNAVTFVNYFETVTAIQIFYPPYNQVQYFEVYDDDYITNVVALNSLTTKDYVDGLIGDVNTILATLTEVSE